jgi:hypothetical protein
LSLKVTAREELVEEDVVGEDVAWRMGGRHRRGTHWGGAHPRGGRWGGVMTHKYRWCIVVLLINKSVESNEEQKVLTSGLDQGFTVNTSKQVFRGIWKCK